MSHLKLQEEESGVNQRPEGLQDVALLPDTRPLLWLMDGELLCPRCRRGVGRPFLCGAVLPRLCPQHLRLGDDTGGGGLKVPRVVSDLLPALPQHLLRASQHPPGSVLSHACQPPRAVLYAAPPKCPRLPGAQRASHSAVWAKPSRAAHSVLVPSANVGGICCLSETSLLAGLCWWEDCLQPPMWLSGCSPLSGKGFSKTSFPGELLLLLVTHCQFSAFRPQLIQPCQPLASC